MPDEVDFGIVASAADAPGTSDAVLYRNVLEDCELAEELGFSTAWMIEHHFSDYFPVPCPLLMMAHVAARFPRLQLGTCVLVTPWYEPLRLAEEIAMLSLLTEQPIHLGIGRGTAKYEYDTFGLDMEESRERFEETWEIVRTALRGEPFTFSGRYRSVPKRVTLRPKVAGVTTDRINFYGAIGSPGSAEIMARLGLPPMCTTIGNYATQVDILRRWNEATRAVGFPTDVMKPIMVNCVIADTDAEAVALAQEYIPRFMQAQVDHYTPDETDWERLESYRGWKGQFEGMKRYTDPRNIPTWTEYQFVGSPETVQHRVQMYVDAGFNHLFLHTATPGVPTEIRREWTRRFALEVAPVFTGAAVR